MAIFIGARLVEATGGFKLQNMADGICAAMLQRMEPTQPAFPRRHHLVIGGSGAVGRYLLRRLHMQAAEVTAISRTAAPHWATDWPSVHWLRGGFEVLGATALTQPVDILSAGPLDALADWMQQTELPGSSRLVALSSMSLEWKRDSPNPAERALAERLRCAEAILQAQAARQSITVTLLRPTLIYGAGIDRSLTPLLRFAQRWGILPWPRRARGLRQPVHADDVAAGMLAALSVASTSTVLALPGGQTIQFDRMIDCLLSRLAPSSRRVVFPLPVSNRVLHRIATGHGISAARAAVLWRSSQDQLAPAHGWSTLGVELRKFAPEPADFEPW